MPGPNQTIRFLVEPNFVAENGLKPYAHFTLGCTEKPEESVVRAIDELGEFLDHKKTEFTVNDVVNLGSDEKPLYALRLDLSNKPELLDIFKKFDDVMWPERNGITYLWKPSYVDDKTQVKMPHIMLGPDPEHLSFGKTFIGYKIPFCSIDYKNVFKPKDSANSNKLIYRIELKPDKGPALKY